MANAKEELAAAMMRVGLATGHGDTIQSLITEMERAMSVYLIAHKVHGEPAFDVAATMDCPHCQPLGAETLPEHCHECDHTGFWWIIPTSGHRAYPWWFQALDGLGQGSDIGFWPDPITADMPPDLPDHYPPRAEPQRSLVDLLGLTTKPQVPSTPIVRRF